MSSRRRFSSVSPLETAKFNALHEEWWDPDKNPLIHMNSIRMEYIQRQATTLLLSSSSSSSSSQQEQEQEQPSHNKTKNHHEHEHQQHQHQHQHQHHPHFPLQGLRLLDVGCGGGLLSESLARLGAEEVTGLDPSPQLIQVAQERAAFLFPSSTTTTTQQPEQGQQSTYPSPRRRPNYHCTTVEEWARQFQLQQQEKAEHSTSAATPAAPTTTTTSSAERYDVVCMMDVIEHISTPHLDSLLTAISQWLLKPGGLFIVSTLNRTAWSYWLTIVGAEYILGYVPRGTHDWNWYRSPTEVETLLQPYALSPVHVCGMVLTTPPPLPIPIPGRGGGCGCGGWNWKLDPHNTAVNWVGTYRRSSVLPD